jgi:hypothetical protein
MNKVLPWVKVGVAVIGLFFALYTSDMIRENYVYKDQLLLMVKTGKELSSETMNFMRAESLKEANFHLVILWGGVLVSAFWLGASFNQSHNKKIKPTRKPARFI